MNMDKMTMERKEERETEYIIPYKDKGIENKISLKFLGVVWTFLLLLKIICQDREWGFFLIFTALLLLFMLPFFITKEKTRDLKTAVQTQETSPTASLDSSCTVVLPSPPTSSDSEEEGPISSSSFSSMDGKYKPAYTLFGQKKQRKDSSSSLSLEEKTEHANYTLFYNVEDVNKEVPRPSSRVSFVPGPLPPASSRPSSDSSESESSSSFSSMEGKDKARSSSSSRSLEKKTEDPNYMLFYKTADEKEPTSRISSVPDGPADYVPLDLPSSSSFDEKVGRRMTRSMTRTADYTLLAKDTKEKKNKLEDEKKSPLEAAKKYGPQYTLFRKASDYQENFDDKKTNIIIEEEIYIRDEDSEDEVRTIEARLEIEKVPSKNLDEVDIVVDPDEENPMHVDVQAQVGEGKAEVRAEIQQGEAEDKDKVNLEVASDDTDSHEMELKARQTRKESLRSYGKEKKRSKSDQKNKKCFPSSQSS